MDFRILFKGQIPKENDYPNSLEDAMEVDESFGKIAISDGASESFDSRSWSRILVKEFIKSKNRKFTMRLLCSAINDYKKIHDISKMSWSQQNAYERGSFATLLCVSYSTKNEKIEILAVGDTTAVLFHSNGMVKSFPYSSAERFQARPQLLSSESKHNMFFESPSQFRATWKVSDQKQAILFCMTDALAEWAFRANNGWSRLAEIKDQSDFDCLVSDERKHGKMRIDDTTLLTVSFV